MKVWIIARLTLKKLFRAAYLIPPIVLTVVVIFSFLGNAKTLPAKPILQELSAMQDFEYRVVDAASSSIFFIVNIFLWMSGAYLGATFIPNEINSGHMRMNLTKPVTTGNVLLGHFTGMMIYLAASSLFMTLVLTVMMYLRGGDPGLQVLGYVAHLIPLFGCLLALGMVLSTVFPRPLTFMALIIFYFENTFEFMIELSRSGIGAIYERIPAEIVGWIGFAISPPVRRLRNAVQIAEFANFDFPWAKYLLVLLYCVSYVFIALFLSSVALRRKEV